MAVLATPTVQATLSAADKANCHQEEKPGPYYFL